MAPMYNDLIIIQKEMGDVNSYFMGPLRGPGFKGFRGFCPLTAGGFKGLWYRRFAAMSLYAVEVLHRTSKSAEVGP